jgi:hypothetical protein
LNLARSCEVPVYMRSIITLFSLKVKDAG